MNTVIRTLFAGLIVLPLYSVAADRNDIPDCYAFTKLDTYQPQFSGRDLAVVVDETTNFSPDLRNEALAHVLRFVQPGDKIRLFQMSAYISESHMNLMFAGTLQAPPSDDVRRGIGMKSLKQLDACLARQKSFFQIKFAQQLGKSFGAERNQIDKSEILFSVKQISEGWGAKDNQNRILFMVSDMLENSEYTSFYKSNQIRAVDVKAEMKKVNQANLQAKLNGVRVYVQGAGLIAPTQKNSYRSGKMLNSIESFWHEYFTASGAELVNFGTPSMINELE